MSDETPGTPKTFKLKLKRRTAAELQEYLFEKMFLQVAHISILEEALENIRNDLHLIAEEYSINVTSELAKIDIALNSASKLKLKGTS